MLLTNRKAGFAPGLKMICESLDALFPQQDQGSGAQEQVRFAGPQRRRRQPPALNSAGVCVKLYAVCRQFGQRTLRRHMSVYHALALQAQRRPAARIQELTPPRPHAHRLAVNAPSGAADGCADPSAIRGEAGLFGPASTALGNDARKVWHIDISAGDQHAYAFALQRLRQPVQRRGQRRRAARLGHDLQMP